MGVNQLWGIVEDARQEMPLSDLRGLTVAIDLGFWVCQMQTAVSSSVIKPHLRNLFFRIWALLQKGIRLLFVADGQPPHLKAEAMKQRQEARNCREGKVGCGISSGTSRNRFLRDLNECCELIQLLGLPCIKADGEAEALCAALNRDGLVDAVISDDSDAFLYGSDKLLRGFNLDTSEPTIQMYSLHKIQDILGLNRNDLVVLSVLLGCDYIPKGVPGIGKEIALGFIHCLKRYDLNPLIRLEELCKSGGCGTHLKTFSKEESAVIRKMQGMQINFDGISVEYLVERLVPITVLQRGFDWRAPKFDSLMTFLSSKLDWKSEYCVAKLVPFLTYWTLNNGKENQLLEPIQILKSRVKQGVECFEVQWRKLDSDKITPDPFYVTIEKSELMNKEFSGLVNNFKDSLALRKCKGKSGTKVGTKSKTKTKRGTEKADGGITKLKKNIILVDLDDSLSTVPVINRVTEPEVSTIDALCANMESQIQINCSTSNQKDSGFSDSPLPLWERIKKRTTNEKSGL